MFSRKAYQQRVEWFEAARFGMFVHWGLYAIPSRGEWLRSDERIPRDDYMRYFAEWNPRAFDPAGWARAAKQAGMEYIVLTAKHHDGFCLYDTATTDFKSTNTAAGQDYVRLFLEAARAEGLRAGLYYSILDWYHEDFPHYGDRYHPMRDDGGYANEHRDFDRYLTYMHEQVRELCANYGRLDILWFDFSYDKLRGDAWKAAELMAMVRSLQPDVIIDNRLEVSGEGMGSLAEGNPTPYHGDFVSPEKLIPPEGLRDINGEPLLWESCVTMNNHWGYCATDHFYKPASLLIKKLVECVSKGGNLLLNVGPDANGRIPRQSLEILGEIGRWMERNAASIRGCGPAGLPKPEYGRITRRGNVLYYHLFENTIGPVPLFGVSPTEVDSIRRLADGSEVPVSTDWIHSDYPEYLFADLGPDPVMPDPVDTVLEVRLKEI